MAIRKPGDDCRRVYHVSKIESRGHLRLVVETSLVAVL
jgi:hypothetical protein